MIAVRRLAMLPLDERPCNHLYPQMLGPVAGVEVKVPPLDIMGRKKRPGDTAALAGWLEEEATRADALVVAAETLVFGGLVPSRVVDVGPDQARARLEALTRVRRRRPDLPVFAQSVILRLPSYDSDDEEPSYWASYGRALHAYSILLDAIEQGEDAWNSIASTAGSPASNAWLPEELAGLRFDRLAGHLRALEADIPADAREDFLRRRSDHHRLNQELVGLAASGVIDFLALTQDDSSPLGLPAREQRALRRRIGDVRAFRKVLVYPGADETGLVLMARHVLRSGGLRPRVAVRFSSTAGPLVVPKYEDRPLLEGVKAQITALGGLWDAAGSHPDVLLFVNSPDGLRQYEAPSQHLPGSSVGSGRSLPEFLEAVSAAVEGRWARSVALADAAYGNGADRDLVAMLPAYVHPLRLDAFAGWNTASNTIGTALAHAALRLAGEGTLPAGARAGAARAHRAFLGLRFAEDWAYQAVVRQEMARGPVAALGISPYRLGQHRAALEPEALRRLREVFGAWCALWPEERAEDGGAPGETIRLDGLEFPWERLFEVGLSLSVVPQAPEIAGQKEGS